MARVNRFIRYFGRSCVAGLLCDREFVGKAWFQYLKESKIPFYIRIKNNAVTTNRRGRDANVWRLFLGLKYPEQRQLEAERKVYGVPVYLTGVRCDTGEPLIVASNAPSDCAIEIYRRRWEVETLFSCLKGRGFRFEDTHITNPERIHKLVAVVAIAFAWAHRVGEWRHETQEPIKLKKHGRLANSLFRYGLDFIRQLLFTGKFSVSRFRQCLRQLRVTIPPINHQVITL